MISNTRLKGQVCCTINELKFLFSFFIKHFIFPYSYVLLLAYKWRLCFRFTWPQYHCRWSSTTWTMGIFFSVLQIVFSSVPWALDIALLTNFNKNFVGSFLPSWDRTFSMPECLTYPLCTLKIVYEKSFWNTFDL